MVLGLLCLCGPVLAGDPVIARFETDGEILEITAADVSEAAPLFGDQGPGLAFELAPDAGVEFADLTERAKGQTLTFSVCGEVLVRAVVQERISGRGQVGLDSLGEANFYARVLNGEISC